MLSKPLVGNGELSDTGDQELSDALNIEKTPEHSSLTEIFKSLGADWEKTNPANAPLLAAVKKTDFARNNQIGQIMKWDAAVNKELLPFHHLISLEKLAPAQPLDDSKDSGIPSQNSSADRRQYFWQQLTAAGVSAQEAALFDDSLQCHFTEQVAGESVEVDWEAFFYDALGACAEVYRAEMFVVKRRIYEAGASLRSIIEITARDLQRYLPPERLAPFAVEDVHCLFMNNLFAPSTLTISGTTEVRHKSVEPGESLETADSFGTNRTNRNKSSKAAPKTINSSEMYGTKRLDTWMTREQDEREWEEIEEIADNEQSAAADDQSPEAAGLHAVIRATLAAYWLGWQRLALAARFDFDYLETLNDSRAIRFYELTKLWRASLITHSGDSLPTKLEIEYDKFVCLMPLPHLKSVKEIKNQLRGLIKPFKDSGYVKSFAVEASWRGIENRAVRLTLRFAD